MMFAMIMKDLTTKLAKYIDEQGGVAKVTPSWVNDWLSKNSAPFTATIIDEAGNEIKGARVAIKKKSGR